MRDQPAETRPPLDDPTSTPSPVRGRWLPVAGSAAAALLLIALLAALLATHANARPTARTSTATPTATATALPMPTATPSGPQWQPIASYTDVSGLVLAPSDTRIAYQMAIESASKFDSWLVLRGTRDTGATWVDIAPPAPLLGLNGQDFDQPYNIAVSPLDPNMVFLTVSADMAGCPSGAAQSSVTRVAFASSEWCTVQWYSRDGGASWHILSLPAGDLLSAIVAQGSLLWGMIGPPLTAQDTTAPAGHLAKSSNGGVTWAFADSGLPRSVGIALYAPATAGHAVFVVSDRADRFNSQVCGGCLPTADYRVWRSDNASGSWTQVAALPYHDVDDYAASADVAGDASALYLDVYTPESGAPMVLASRDEGRTWAPSGATGIDASAPLLDGLLGVLPDGSVIAAYSPPGDAQYTTHTLYAWKPGDTAWHALTAPFDSTLLRQLLVSAPGSDGRATLTLQYDLTDGTRVATLSVT